MIIGLSGYIGSGKDEVGKIIQYLTTHPHSLDKTDDKNRSYNSFVMDVGMGFEPIWKIKKFAEKLKQIASILTGIPIEKFEDQEFKKTFLGLEWNKVFGHAPQIEKMTVREFLQRLGTEGIRNGVHKNAWVNALFADYKGKFNQYSPLTGMESQEGFVSYPNWIITDCRFPNEAQAIIDRKGIVVRIDRYQKKHKSIGLHPSETSLDDWKFDYIIDNNRTIEELIEKVREMLIKFNLLS